MRSLSIFDAIIGKPVSCILKLALYIENIWEKICVCADDTQAFPFCQ